MSDPWKQKTYQNQERYPQQTEIQLNKVTNATEEEWDEWQEKELEWWGDRQLPLVFIMALVQLGALGFMFTTFYIISIGLGK